MSLDSNVISLYDSDSDNENVPLWNLDPFPNSTHNSTHNTTHNTSSSTHNDNLSNMGNMSLLQSMQMMRRKKKEKESSATTKTKKKTITKLLQKRKHSDESATDQPPIKKTKLDIQEEKSASPAITVAASPCVSAKKKRKNKQAHTKKETEELVQKDYDDCIQTSSDLNGYFICTVCKEYATTKAINDYAPRKQDVLATTGLDKFRTDRIWNHVVGALHAHCMGQKRLQQNPAATEWNKMMRKV
eukprot:CAMPEP_0202703412 /NCGR_PEP_ID=MMETSP1385-20130828/16268_1 /ASSEMBLY_ACC=CAM_ASM_000861 /TAXON_ID=933848 /ORGANISM="Elphidium margaritaceum" /LENGTH=243 /DNA_ID=CAMNT_0049361265 /DNA_START=73 /DNA_END=800 /DNA_ORIENTATION=-